MPKKRSRKEINKRYYQKRYKKHRALELKRQRRYVDEWQKTSRSFAERHNEVWSAAEDAELLKLVKDHPIHFAAVALGRTFSATKSRYHTIKNKI